MFIVTNREVDERRTDVTAFGEVANRHGPNELRMAEAQRIGGKWKITILPDQISAAMATDAELPHTVDANGNAVDEKGDPIFASRYVARKLLARVNPRMVGDRRSKGRGLLFYVHGFNNNVKDVLDRAARLSSTYGVEVLSFSWPANGGGFKGVASYKSDKRDAQASVGALDRCLAKLSDYLQSAHQEHVAKVEKRASELHGDNAEKWDQFFTRQAEQWCDFPVTMMLHSMGNYLYKHLLMSSAYRGNVLIFDNIVMAAADANNEAHREWVDRIPVRRRLFITINENDGALRASRMKMGEEQKARLGHWPFDLESQRAVYVDFTHAKAIGDSHAYFESSPVTKNQKVYRFFQQAFDGDAAEEGLIYDAARNLYRVK